MREHSSHDNSTLKLLQMSDSFPLVCSNLKKKKLSNKIEKIQITPTQLRRISRMRTVDECENEDTLRLCTAAVRTLSIICAHSRTQRLSRRVLMLPHLSASIRPSCWVEEWENEDKWWRMSTLLLCRVDESPHSHPHSPSHSHTHRLFAFSHSPDTHRLHTAAVSLLSLQRLEPTQPQKTQK